MSLAASSSALMDYVRQSPSFLRGYQMSQPDGAIVDRIREALPEATVVVVAEYWCSDSRRLVPVLARIGTLLPGWQFEVYPWERTGRVKELGVQAIPTFVIFSGEQEIGRIVEYPRTGSLEQDLLLVAGQH